MMPGVCHAREREEVLPLHGLGWLGEDVAEGDVEAERACVHLAGDHRLHTEAQAVVDHAVALDGRMMAIGFDDEREEVAEVDTADAFELASERVARSR
ncbi:MAG: hypothetical protein KF764_01965 [Labilithrix sp.]|nr:hypothetical protein [Labilithrix sp.]